MGQAIPTQHPAVVLRSHYTHLRTLLTIAMIAVIGLSTAVVILAGDDGTDTSATPAAATSSESAGRVLVVPPPRWAPGAGLRVTPPPTGQRYDGGPDEGTRGIVAQPPTTRYDGGPDEGSRGPGR
jgi:hypothetical protein